MKIYQRVPFMQLIIDLLAHLIQAQTDSLSFPIAHSTTDESFTGYHVKLCCFEVPIHFNIQRNSSGYITSKSGINEEMLKWLSSKHNFTYECLTFPPSVGPSFPNTSSTIGFYHMLQFQMCDFIAGPVVMMHSRFLHFDFITSYMESPVMMLIPKPKLSFSHVDAIWKPFQPIVWLVLLITLVTATIVIALLNHFSNRLENVNDGPPQNFSYLIKAYGLFVFQSITLRGGNLLHNNKLRMRLVMGTWCLMSFVLLTYYSSAFTSFIMAPRYQSLISSVYELAKSKDANPVVMKGLGSDILISNSEDPIMKELSQKIDADPDNRRCYNATMCFELVKNGPNVYIDGRMQLVLAMAKDFEKTGKCNGALVSGESLFVYHLVWGVRWGDPRKEVLNRGILRMRDSGLIDWWGRRMAGSERCVIEEIRPADSLRPQFSKLTISNLQGPFAVLVCGFVLSIFSWIVEIVVFLFRRFVTLLRPF